VHTFHIEKNLHDIIFNIFIYSIVTREDKKNKFIFLLKFSKKKIFFSHITIITLYNDQINTFFLSVDTDLRHFLIGKKELLEIFL